MKRQGAGNPALKRSGAGFNRTLRGRSGHGTSRMARWLTETASEADIAHSVYAFNDRVPTERGGVRSMVQRLLGVRHMNEQQRRTAIEALEPELGPTLAKRAFDLLSGGPLDQDALQTVQELLTLRAANHPLIVIVDDAQWDMASLELAQRCAKADCGPLLFVLTMQHEGLQGRPAAMDALRYLLTQRGVRNVDIGPMDDLQIATLVQNTATLDPNLVSELAQRCDGNPGVALDVLRRWSAQGRLRLEPHGYVADPLSEHFDLWDGLTEQQLERLRLTADDRRALELASLAGPSIQMQAWAGLCRTNGLDGLTELAQRVSWFGVAHECDGRLVFRDRQVVQALRRSFVQARLKRRRRVVQPEHTTVAAAG